MARNKRRALRQLYDTLPALACQGLCADSCGPIDMSTTERAVIRERGVEITDKTVAVKELMETGDFTCPALVNERCSVYDVRPTICRVWGLTESLRCPHGCLPERELTDLEGFEVISESLHAGGSNGDLAPTAKIREAYEKHHDVIDSRMRAHRPT